MNECYVSSICMKMNECIPYISAVYTLSTHTWIYNIIYIYILKSIKHVHPQSLSWLQACVLKLLKNFFTSPEESLIWNFENLLVGWRDLFCFPEIPGLQWTTKHAWGASCCWLVKLSLRGSSRENSRDVAVSSTALTKSEQHFLSHLFTHETTAGCKDASKLWFLVLFKGTHHPFWFTITRMWGSLHFCPLSPPQFWEHHGCFSLPLLAAGLTGRDD